MNRSVKIFKILAAMPNHWTRKCGPGFLRYFNGSWNEQFVVLNHGRRSTRNRPSASLRRGDGRHSMFQIRYSQKRTPPFGIAVMSPSRTVRRFPTGAGAVITLFAAWRYHVINRAIRRGEIQADPQLVITVTAIVVFAALAVIVYMVVSAGSG